MDTSTVTSLRPLTIRDATSLVTLSRLAGWNQTSADWALLLELERDGCLGIEVDGQIVATTTLVCYGDQIAWLGMVLTHPDYRRRGFARRLVESALNVAIARRVQAIKLDATDQGAPLYEKLGFRREQVIQRWSGPGRTPVDRPEECVRDNFHLGLDREAFGADRSRLLRILAARELPVLANDGFALWRPGAHARYLGPCVACSPESAKLLVTRTLALHRGEWLWDLLPANRHALELARSSGFSVARELVRMVKGSEIRGSESMIYAAGGLELG